MFPKEFLQDNQKHNEYQTEFGEILKIQYILLQAFSFFFRHLRGSCFIKISFRGFPAVTPRLTSNATCVAKKVGSAAVLSYAKRALF